MLEEWKNKGMEWQIEGEKKQTLNAFSYAYGMWRHKSGCEKYDVKC